MVKRQNPTRRKTRHLMAKGRRQRGKINLTRYFAKFSLGSRVQLILEPSVHKGSYNTRFYGKAGIVQKSKGSCYFVKIKDGGKEKLVLAHPIHLKLLQ